MTFGPIETERLVLRDWRDSDIEGTLRIMADERWMRYMGASAPPTITDAWRSVAIFVGHRTMRGYTMFAVEEKETGDFVGRVGPWMPKGWPDLEIGWGIDPSRWGRGYAVEAARAAAAWAHAELGADRVIHLIDPANARSIRVAEKLGARPAGTFLMPPSPAGDRVEAVIWRSELPRR